MLAQTAMKAIEALFRRPGRSPTTGRRCSFASPQAGYKLAELVIEQATNWSVDSDFSLLKAVDNVSSLQYVKIIAKYSACQNYN